MLYELLKGIIKISLRVFYRRITVHGKQHFPSNGPLIVVSNHPNTLMDPLLIAANLPQQASFLTKSSYFSTPFRKWLLQKLHMIPVYRAQDQKEAGKSASETVEANRKVFAKCIEFLGDGGTLLIFPEGTSILERKLRDIKTGTARIALGALAEHIKDVKILPIGLNYSDANRFRSEVTITVGTPILVSEFKELYSQQPAAATQKLTKLIREKLENLLIISPDAEQDSLSRQIEMLYADNLLQELQLPKTASQDLFAVKQGIANAVAYFSVHDPVRIRAIHQQTTNYLQGLKRLRLQDKQLQSTRSQIYPDLVGGLVYAVLGFPVFLYGLLHNFIPYRLPGLAADALTEDQEFEAPIMLVTGLLTFPVWYAICLVCAGFLFDFTTLGWALYALSLPLSGFFALHYRATVLSLRGRWQLLYLLSGRKQLVEELKTERARITHLLQQARTDYEAARQNS